MPLSLKTRQVAGVTLIVGLTVIAQSIVNLAWIARVSLEESATRGELLARTVFQQATRVAGGDDPAETLRTDPGIRSILESGLAYSPNVLYVAIAWTDGTAMAHSTPVQEGERLPDQPLIQTLLSAGPIEQIRAIYSDRTFEVREKLLRGEEEFGTIRIGLSMLLVRQEIERALRPAALATALALVVATLGAMLFAQWVLRPINVLSTGLSRLGRGEFDVKLDLPPGDEFDNLEASFDRVSAELSAVRSRLAGQPAHFESIADRLEDAVVIASPGGDVLFANAAMRRLMPGLPARGSILPAIDPNHPLGGLLETVLASRTGQGPVSMQLPAADGATVEHVVTAHAISGADQRSVGVMLVARNVAYLSQMQSTLKYSRKLASFGRLLAGVAHEVKNPLNAMTIHLELLKQKLLGGAGRRRSLAGRSAVAATSVTQVAEVAPAPVDAAAVLQHATIIGQEIRRLDEVVQGFLRFSRPEELRLESVSLAALVDEVVGVIGPDASGRHVHVKNDCPPDLPSINGDAAMVRQALLNLALNACEAMPSGGTLRFSGHPRPGNLVELTVEDTGIGIPAENLDRIFDLYFTTREGGSGIGLSMVYRAVHLHDGTIEVESTAGRGSKFRIVLPQA